MVDAPAPPPARPKNLFTEFREFLDKYGVIGLAIAFVIGVAVTEFVKTLVAEIVNPIVLAFLPGGDWRTARYDPPFFDPIGWGPALGAFVNFAIIAAFVFLFAKYVLREASVAKK